MQQEDDLRGLAKVMEFMRAISIVFIVIHVYWFCYSAFVDMGINIGVVDRILLNFQRTAGLFSNLLVTKVFAFIFLGLSCLGTKGVKNQKMTWRKIYAAFLGGIVLFFMNWWMLDLPFSTTVNATVYTLTLTTGYILLLMSGIWISRMLKHNLMEDVFNTANYNPQIQISAESETKRSIFREKDKTKRSKKESAQHSKSRNKSFVMTSVSAL